jgi:hypothetical protein
MVLRLSSFRPRHRRRGRAGCVKPIPCPWIVSLIFASDKRRSTRETEDRQIARAAALLFAGLVAAYAASRTTGITLLAPDREPVDAVGVSTKLVEALGFAAALRLVQPIGRHRRRPTCEEVPR